MPLGELRTWHSVKTSVEFRRYLASLATPAERKTLIFTRRWHESAPIFWNAASRLVAFILRRSRPLSRRTHRVVGRDGARRPERSTPPEAFAGRLERPTGLYSAAWHRRRVPGSGAATADVETKRGFSSVDWVDQCYVRAVQD